MTYQYCLRLWPSQHTHRDQRRKDIQASPYINHPIGLSDVLVNEGGVTDINVLCSAILHDTIEDTDTSYDELVVAEHKEKTGIEIDENVMISAGNMQGLNTPFHTMLDPGDEIILTDPCFASHIQQINLFSGKSVYWPLDENNNWSLNIDLSPELITDKTQAIVLVSPSNPTGKIFSEVELIRSVRSQNDTIY